MTFSSTISLSRCIEIATSADYKGGVFQVPKRVDGLPTSGETLGCPSHLEPGMAVANGILARPIVPLTDASEFKERARRLIAKCRQ
jgi:hypothetical protein